MLRTRTRTRATAVLLLMAVLLSTALLHSGRAAAAAGPAPCDNGWVCVGVSTGPSDPSSGGGTSGGGGGVAECVYQGKDVACSNEYGTFNPSDGCYYKVVDPQPPAGDPYWQGHQPGDGAIYLRTCSNQGAGGSLELWEAAPPPAPPIVTPGELAARALAQIHLARPVVHTAPQAGQGSDRTALVGAPIWLWIDRGANAYAAQPLVRSAAVPGLSVTVTVSFTGMTWNMGDGGTANCAGSPGTPYQASDGGAKSPTCGYTYAKSSAGQTDQLYLITATTDWHVHWQATDGTHEDYDLDPIAGPATALKVSELQVLN